MRKRKQTDLIVFSEGNKKGTISCCTRTACKGKYNRILIHDINKSKDNNHLIISIDAQKAFDKLHCPFMIKTLRKVVIEGAFLNIIKVI